VDLVAGRHPATVASLAPRLAEERRLFYVAVTRARRQLLVSAVMGEEEAPSRFLSELDGRELTQDDMPVTEPLRGTHLGSLVAELRAVVTDPGAPSGDREAAAAQLARLAAANVPGADPDQWWGLLPLSDDGPVADPQQPVPVSPSRIESFLDCEVRALLADLGVRAGEQAAASLGTLVHEIAATAPPDADVAKLEDMLDARWSELDFGAAWFAEHERVRAGEILARLAGWLRSSRAGLELVGAERRFSVQVGDAQLSGSVDRLERDQDGRLVVVDLKTGKRKPAAADVPSNAQLGAYQLAVEHGAFAADGQRCGGAMLVQLAGGAKAAEQRQPPLSEAADRRWVENEVASVAARMRGNRFTATVSSRICRMCDVRASCPIQPEGRQVTEQ
jgi:RecB family exonuclease